MAFLALPLSVFMFPSRSDCFPLFDSKLERRRRDEEITVQDSRMNSWRLSLVQCWTLTSAGRVNA
jgi:hypothetical protein